MKNFCVRITLPVVKGKSADEVNEKIVEALESFADDTPFMKTSICEYKDGVLDDIL